jgi:hypothetical protein
MKKLIIKNQTISAKEVSALIDATKGNINIKNCLITNI